MDLKQSADIPSQLRRIADILESEPLEDFETASRKEQTRRYCKATGLDLETLAIALRFTHETITVEQIAIRLGVTRQTLYNLPKFRKFMRIKAI